MKAATQNAYGTPDILKLVEVERPPVGDNDVLVQVHASIVSQGDRRLRSSDFPGMSWLPGRLMMGVFKPNNPVPGTMYAGQVAAVGSKVSRFKVGDDVFGSVDFGAHAEFLATASDGPIAPMPKGVDYTTAVAIPYGAGTAQEFLGELADVQEGEHVLILGASGGVGRFAIQLAKHLGAEVTGVATARNHELMRSLGADHVIDYSTEDFRNNGQRYDVIFDTVGAVRFDQARDSLTEAGRYLSLIVSMRLLFAVLTTWLFGGKRALFGVAMGNQQTTERLADLTEQGVFRPVIDSTWSLTQLRDAHVHLETGQTQGSVVIAVADVGLRIAAK